MTSKICLKKTSAFCLPAERGGKLPYVKQRLPSRDGEYLYGSSTSYEALLSVNGFARVETMASTKTALFPVSALIVLKRLTPNTRSAQIFAHSSILHFNDYGGAVGLPGPTSDI